MPLLPPGDRAARLALPLAAAAAVAAYLALLGSLGGLPFCDLPNHLARADILSDLLFRGGARFGGQYRLELAAVPYVLGDLALATLVRLFGPYPAGRIWICLCALGVPAAAAVYLRAAGLGLRSVLVGLLLSLYLSTDWFLVNGLGHYRLAIAATLLAAAAWERFLATGRPGAFAACAAALLGGYLLHLSALLFGAAALAVAAAVALRQGRTTWRRAASGALPVLALGAWHAAHLTPNPGGDRLFLLSPAHKLLATASPFVRYGLPGEAALLGLFLLAAGLLAWSGRRALRRPEVVAGGAVALSFLALYAALPHGRGTVTYVDVRAVPLAALFGAFAALAAADRAARPSPLAAWAAALLAFANLGTLAAHLRPADREMRAYREIAARVPPGATVLPVATRPLDGRSNPFLHAGTLATVESGAVTPYLFLGGVTPYVRWARPKPPAPSEFWYQGDGAARAPASVRGAFGYCLVMSPYDPARLPGPVSVVAENRSAALLAFVP
ncbi:hypothetical protein [Anaeromyxobacter paludicola]|uniref:Glycosyltransferase RgtA/B/C/D-like domain-containing protein n=1 Tax=Anaeromyxobacter paludicola TaxID=2918171 RepID=A0ABN6N6J4_9BACT|nr:hypothetical protein [Anaeromyxobacter paludicola]BDG07438.1 hypothetical protein AMPC_05510 [Anaeromyxobacter paludicola]